MNWRCAGCGYLRGHWIRCARTEPIVQDVKPEPTNSARTVCMCRFGQDEYTPDYIDPECPQHGQKQRDQAEEIARLTERCTKLQAKAWGMAIELKRLAKELEESE